MLRETFCQMLLSIMIFCVRRNCLLAKKIAVSDTSNKYKDYDFQIYRKSSRERDLRMITGA